MSEKSPQRSLPDRVFDWCEAPEQVMRSAGRFGLLVVGLVLAIYAVSIVLVLAAVGLAVWLF